MVPAPKRSGRIMRFELTDGEWGVIKPMLSSGQRDVPAVDHRCTLNYLLGVAADHPGSEANRGPRSLLLVTQLAALHDA
jgi:hypothetical protein